MTFDRALDLTRSTRSFFLWGPRQAGKSCLLAKTFPDAFLIDLLKSEVYTEYARRPELLRERLSAANLPTDATIVIDEVQKVPQLLNEAHYLIEHSDYRFALCGSSARKVKRGKGNLLGGRALRYELLGLSAYELSDDFNLTRLLNRGTLPPHYLADDFHQLLRSYVANYLQEEILEEGLVRKLPVFSRFLEVAAIGDTEAVNFTNIARESGTSAKTIQSYYQILEDTYIGSFLPAYARRPKRRIVKQPKFYFHDVGVVNQLAKRRQLEAGNPLFGKAFENWIFHEIVCFNKYTCLDYELATWRLTTGAEVDFIIGDMEIAIESKASSHVHSRHLKNLRVLQEEHPCVRERVVVCLETEPRRTTDGILILPYHDFVKRLWRSGPAAQQLTFE